MDVLECFDGRETGKISYYPHNPIAQLDQCKVVNKTFLHLPNSGRELLAREPTVLVLEIALLSPFSFYARYRKGSFFLPLFVRNRMLDLIISQHRGGVYSRIHSSETATYKQIGTLQSNIGTAQKDSSKK